MKRLYQQGISLLELMIALALGLVLVAVAVQMFISSQANLSLQRSLGDLQDNGLFGIDFISKDLRKINLGAALPVLDSKIAQGGILLSFDNIMGSNTENVSLAGFNGGDLSLTGVGVNNSNFTGQNSDQLTIQYKTVQNVYDDATFLRKINNGLSAAEKQIVVGYDCEGGKIVLDDVANQVYVVQRYFVKPTNSTTTTTNNPNLALYCDAGRYQLGAIDEALAATANENRVVTVAGIGSNGQIVLRRVDHFRVLLGVATGEYSNSQNFRYMTLDAYKALSGDNLPKIRSVKLGLVIRSQDRIPSASVKENNSFNILDLADQSLIGGQDNYMRQVLTQTIALRNALGEDLR
jgi:type IV pilus assembly protein PilW